VLSAVLAWSRVLQNFLARAHSDSLTSVAKRAKIAVGDEASRDAVEVRLADEARFQCRFFGPGGEEEDRSAKWMAAEPVVRERSAASECR